jgi:outer membrane protein OmpA-like peptidoglycan-associated protein
LRYFDRAMNVSTLRRFIVTAALLGVALLSRASPDAIAADASDRDVQVNLDVLDSLGPAPDASATGTTPIHLHPPRPKIDATHPAAAAPQKPPRAPAAAVATAAPPRDGAPAKAAADAASSAPPSAGSNPLPAPTAAAAATPAPPPAPAPVTAMNAPPAVKSPAAKVAPAAAPPAAPKAPPPPPTRLLFATGAVDLPDGDKPKLDAVAEWLDTNQQARIEVVAYAAGSAEQANDARRTSLTRALAVRKYLADHGVATTRMEVRALGNHSAEGDPPDRVDIAPLEH